MASSRAFALVSLFAAVIAVLGLIPKIDLGVGVPITAQTLGVMLAGCLLGPKKGLQAVLLFLGGVALGLPLLSGGRGGLAVFAAPPAGYLLAWPLGALVSGWIMWVLPSSTPLRAALGALLAALVGGVLVIHAGGVVGLVQIANMTWLQALVTDLIYVPGDVIKCVLCALVVHTVARGIPEWQFGGKVAL